MDKDNGGDQDQAATATLKRPRGGSKVPAAAVVPARHLVNHVSDSSLSHPLHLPSASSSSSTSSTSCSLAAAGRQPKRPKFGVAVAGGASAIGRSAGPKNSRAKKCDRKWTCPNCGGDVRLPPPNTTTDTDEALTSRQDGDPSRAKGRRDDIDVEKALDLIAVMCALKCCPAPRYHLKCSGVPEGSEIFRNTVILHQMDKGAVKKKYDPQRILQHLYSSSERAWWDLPTDTNIVVDGAQFRQKSQQALQNDVNWPTSMLSFMCPACDVEGASRFLSEYFERFHSMKTSFYVNYLSECDGAATGLRRDRADESVDTRTGEAFLRHLIVDNRKKYPNTSSTMEKPAHCGSWNPSEIRLERMAFTRTFLSKQCVPQQKQQHLRQQEHKLSPSDLVGKPLRLFNPIDRSYHSGRIIDCKIDAPYKVDQPAPTAKPISSFATAPISHLTDENICNTLFLIRFRHGVEGRKVTVHQWIYLEEHAVTVGGEVCLAKVGVANKEAGKSGKVKSADPKKCVSEYRPVQLVFRSMLEMVPVPNMNPLTSYSGIATPLASGREASDIPRLNVLAMGFGPVFSHVRLSFNNSDEMAAGTRMSEADETQKSIFGEAATDEPVALPLAPNNPPWIDRMVHRAQLSDENVALGLAAACMEKEEERRIRTWSRSSASPLPLEKTHDSDECAEGNMICKDL